MGLYFVRGQGEVMGETRYAHSTHKQRAHRRSASLSFSLSLSFSIEDSLLLLGYTYHVVSLIDTH